MTCKKLRTLIPLLLLLTACAQTPITPKDIEQKVDLWLQQQQYDKALKALVKAFPSHPDPARLKILHKEVSSEATSYEKKTVRHAKKLISEGKWADALELYERAIKNYSKGVKLKKGLNKLHDIQAERIDELEIDILIKHAKWLENSLVMYTAIANTSPKDRRAQSALKKKRKEIKKISAQLTERGTNALRQGDIKTAERLVPLAMRLDPNTKSERAYKALRKISKPKKTKKTAYTKKTIPASKKKITAKELYSDFNEAYRTNRLADAQQILSQLEIMEAGSARLEELRRRLDNDISITINREMKVGVSQYSRGEPEQAIIHWQKVIELDPGNDLAQAHIHRAKLILEKLKQLRKKQPLE